MSGKRKRLKNKLSAQTLKAKRLSTRMKARTRRRRERDVDTVTETPISLRSKWAWVTILLMVLVIVAAGIRVHPKHYKVEYALTETDENPYMGTLDADDGYLKSVNWSWAQAEPADDEYTAPETAEVNSGVRYVLIFDGDDVPDHVQKAAQEANDADAYTAERLNKCVKELCAFLSDTGNYAYLQTDSELHGLDSEINGIYLLCRASDGLYRAPDGSESSWTDSPVAGSSDRIFGGHLTYVIESTDENIAGRVGWALGVRYAEWHSFTRRGDRLFVNMMIDNAGVASPYCAHDLILTLWHGGEIYASKVQSIDLKRLSSEAVSLNGYIDIPYNLECGLYELCVSINVHGDGSARLSLTMPDGNDGYYKLGVVRVK